MKSKQTAIDRHRVITYRQAARKPSKKTYKKIGEIDTD